MFSEQLLIDCLSDRVITVWDFAKKKNTQEERSLVILL